MPRSFGGSRKTFPRSAIMGNLDIIVIHRPEFSYMMAVTGDAAGGRAGTIGTFDWIIYVEKKLISLGNQNFKRNIFKITVGDFMLSHSDI